MIPAAKIKNIINTLSQGIGITIIRADQDGHKPGYPYATYKIISTQEESAHQNIKKITESGDQAAITNYEATKDIISFNFINKDDIFDIRSYVTLALQWFKSTAGRDYCKDQEITVRLVSPSVEDRSVYLESFFENKLGFDIRFDYTGEVVDTIESIQSIEITPTVDEDVKTTITVTGG